MAAFVGDEVRGVDIDGATFFPPGGVNVWEVSLYSNQLSGETITFKYYDDVNDVVIDLTESVVFESSAIFGASAFDPFSLTGTAPDCEGGCDDADADGICDDVDDCVGAYDECGICNGDGSSCQLTGDLNQDGSVGVLDVVTIVRFIMGIETPNNTQFTSADLNGDGSLDVVDVVMLVDIIMGENLRRGEAASEAIIYYGNGSVRYIADGIIAGIQLAIKGDYRITGTTLPEGWEITNNEKTIIMYSLDGSNLEDQVLFEYTGEIVIESGIATDWYSSEISISSHPVPKLFSLDRAYPNPFNPTTTLSFAIPIDSEVSLSIYNLQGREVSTLINGNMDAGYHSIVWNADSYSSGVYFVKMVAGEFVNTQKLMLVK